MRLQSYQKPCYYSELLGASEVPKQCDLNLSFRIAFGLKCPKQRYLRIYGDLKFSKSFNLIGFRSDMPQTLIFRGF